MTYDPRLLSPPASFQFSPSDSSGHGDTIELSPWESPSRDYFGSARNVPGSTDTLLPHEHDRLSRRESLWTPRNDIDKSQGWNGWRLGAAICVVVISAVLILNVTLTAWAAITFGLSGGIGTIHIGPCPSIRRIGLWIHIAINVLSTILLGASNYVMQALCSPTRSEVEKAHARRMWLDIGIQSFRNLTKIKRFRMALWILLAASSIPLHLIFNSAVFVSLTANEYLVAAVTEDFINGANWTTPGSDSFHTLLLMDMQQNVSSLEMLDQETCIQQYGVDYLSNRRHVLVVVSGQEPNSLVGYLDWNYNQSRNSWVCGADLGPDMQLQTYSIADYDCSVSVALGNDTWIVGNQQAEYCLSQPVPDQCRLQFAVPIMVVVLCSNFVKLICIALTIWKCRESTFVTLGDALSGLLENPDHHTEGMCIASKKDFDNGIWPISEPKRWVVKIYFRFEAVGIKRYIYTNMICALAVIALSVLLRFAIANTTTSSDIVTLWHLGFGTVTSSSLIRWNYPLFGSPGLMKNVLLANSPQVILSLLYIMYNRMYTCMSFSKEWHDFANRRRPLRVTAPRGDQRSTYFLSLPYHYLIPILGVSVATHWILSQSLFLVAIDVFDETGNFDSSQSILTCGFSCIAMIFLIVIGWLVFIAGVAMGLRKYKGGMPLVGSCSAAISAACHPASDEPDVALVPVKWGVISIASGVGHCALSGQYVSPPITRRLYMGEREVG